jgi:hemerythrin-like domain-containing protein
VAAFKPVPTAPPTERYSSEDLLDEGARPTGPSPDPAQEYTPAQEAQGQHLIDVHDALRSELVQLRDVIDQLERGGLDPDAARGHLAKMTIRQNSWTVGTFCLQYCRALTGHHSLEDASVFPHLQARAPELSPVIDCLFAEHEVIAASLDRIDAALVRFIEDPAQFGEVRRAVDAMSDALLSHLSYEERELIEPLARVGFH